MYGKARLQSANLMARARKVEKTPPHQESDDELRNARAAMRKTLMSTDKKKRRKS